MVNGSTCAHMEMMRTMCGCVSWVVGAFHPHGTDGWRMKESTHDRKKQLTQGRRSCNRGTYAWEWCVDGGGTWGPSPWDDRRRQYVVSYLYYCSLVSSMSLLLFVCTSLNAALSCLLPHLSCDRSMDGWTRVLQTKNIYRNSIDTVSVNIWNPGRNMSFFLYTDHIINVSYIVPG